VCLLIFVSKATSDVDLIVDELQSIPLLLNQLCHLNDRDWSCYISSKIKKADYILYIPLEEYVTLRILLILATVRSRKIIVLAIVLFGIAITYV